MSSMELIRHVNTLLTVLFFVCYSYQFFYLLVPFFKKDRPHTCPVTQHRYGVLICARNEAAVLPHLLDSLRAQDYPAGLVTVFVMADNCTDATAALAAAGGAVVYRRTDPVQVGKGYALQALLQHIWTDYGTNAFDGFFVFDADNLLQPDYITRMNESFCQGSSVVTGYRNSKNYGDNWISAGYALWFLRESEYLNHARSLLGAGCGVSGTGFLVGSRVLEQCGGWPFHLLTEDIQFTAHCAVQGISIGYCPRAVLYDEQPTVFSQSWRQRMRWAKGYLQVFGRYGGRLLRGALLGVKPTGTCPLSPGMRRLTCFDMAMAILPAIGLTLTGSALNVAAAVLTLTGGGSLWAALQPLAGMLGGTCLLMLVLGALTTVSQWHSIRASALHKVLYVFTFPLFMLTYLPISVAALVAPVRWQPIRHTVAVGLEQVTVPRK